MPFYAQRLPYEKISRKAEVLVNYLRRKTMCVQPKDEEGTEVFIANKTDFRAFLAKNLLPYELLVRGGFLAAYSLDEESDLIYFNPQRFSARPTVAGDSILLPKPEHLYLLTPQDFFTLISLLAAAKPTASKTSLTLNPSPLTETIEESPYGHLFTRLQVAYRLDPQYCTSHWVPLQAFATIAAMPHTAESQLYAIQYLTALTAAEPLYFPIDAMLELGLEWDQLDESYAVPQI